MTTFTLPLYAIETGRIYDRAGNPLSSGPRCLTCGDLAAWGLHPLCQRDDEGLLTDWVDRDDDEEL